MAQNNYGQESIKTFKDEQAVRQRPQVIFGTNDEYGCIHSVFEIIANATDEAMAGHANKIEVTIYKDGSIEVIDNGRGVPMGWNEKEQQFNWKLVFCTMYATGKAGTDNYGMSLGLNGLGATATQYASEYMDVYSTRDGETSYMHFEKGKPVGKLQVKLAVDIPNGTVIKFKPDKEVFTKTDGLVTSYEYYLDRIRRQAMLLDGVEYILKHEADEKQISLRYDNGINDFVDLVTDKPMASTQGYRARNFISNDFDAESFNFDMRVAFNFSRTQPLYEIYHCGSYLSDGGTTDEALKAGMQKIFTEYAVELGKIPKGESILFKDIEPILVCVASTVAPGSKSFFKGQVKSAVTNTSFKKPFNEFIYENFKHWIRVNKTEADRVLTEALVNKEAREQAERVSKKVVQSLSKGVSGFTNMPKKFVDCSSQDRMMREIYIVEGDSAAGSVKLAREPLFQAIMPLRGKILNCMKEDLPRILSSDIIVDLIRVLGCGIEAKSKYIKDLPPFDILKLNWGKVIICTDADVDGMQIRCLVLSMLYRLTPALIKEGKVYIAETPLYEISHKKITEFAYSDAEKDAVIKKFTNMGVNASQLRIQRSKGLGENNPDMMHYSTMAPATRRLMPVDYCSGSTQEQLDVIFRSLLGDDIEGRKELIQLYFEQTEVSE